MYSRKKNVNPQQRRGAEEANTATQSLLLPASILQGMRLGGLKDDENVFQKDGYGEGPVEPLGDSSQVVEGMPVDDDQKRRKPGFMICGLSVTTIRVVNGFAIFVHFLLSMVAIGGRYADSSPQIYWLKQDKTQVGQKESENACPAH